MLALDLPWPLSKALKLDSTGTGADAGSATVIVAAAHGLPMGQCGKAAI